MPEVVGETSNFDTDITVPVGTDLRKAASVRVGFQSLANRTKWLKDTLATLNAAYLGTYNLLNAVINGTTHIHDRRYVSVTATVSTSYNDGNVFVMAGAGDVVLTFADTGASDGDEVEFATGASGQQMLVTMPSGTLPAVGGNFSVKYLSGNYANIKFVRSSGVWKRTGFNLLA